MRSEGDRLVEAVDELIRIAREAKILAEIYHLKAAGESNWNKLDAVIQTFESAQREGLKVTADMYTYTAGATGFDACLPPWSRAGGPDAIFKRLEDPATRAKISAEMKAKGGNWENLCVAAGSAERILVLKFKNEALKPFGRSGCARSPKTSRCAHHSMGSPSMRPARSLPGGEATPPHLLAGYRFFNT